MIEINLLPAEYRPKAVSKFVLPEIPIKKTLLTVTGMIFVIQVFASLFAVYEVFDLLRVKGQIARLEVTGVQVTKEKADISALASRMIKIRSMTERKYYWASLLNSLTRSMSKGVWLTGFSITSVKPGEIKSAPAATRVLKLDGSVVGPGEETASIGKFIKELKADEVFNDLFSSIELSNMVQKKIRDFDVYDFSIYCAFKSNKVDARPEKAASK